MFCVFCALAAPAAAQDQPQAVQPFRTTDLPLPRFVSLKSDKVYMRTGPALRYPIKWVYTRENLPVEIVQEFEQWRKIKDIDGEEGWVHQSLLSGERTVLVKSDDLIPLREKDSADARMVARLEPMVVAHIEKCGAAGWCGVEAGGYEGWVERKFLWGIYPDEVFN